MMPQGQQIQQNRIPTPGGMMMPSPQGMPGASGVAQMMRGPGNPGQMPQQQIPQQQQAMARKPTTVVGGMGMVQTTPRAQEHMVASVIQVPVFPHYLAGAAVKLQMLTANWQAAQAMAARGATEANNPEYAKLINFLKSVSAPQSLPRPPMVPAPAPVAAPQPAAPVDRSLTEKQREALRLQVYAFKILSGNSPIPDPLMRNLADLTGVQRVDGDNARRIVTTSYMQLMEGQGAQPAVKGKTADGELPPVGSKENPFTAMPTALPNASTNMSLLQRSQRFLVPHPAVPIGPDPLFLIRDRDRRVKERVAARIKYLESLPANLTNDPILPDNGSVKLRALIELKGLRLLDRQRRLREEVLASMVTTTTLRTAMDRMPLKRTRERRYREARSTQETEVNHLKQRELQERARVQHFCQQVLAHGREMAQANREREKKAAKFGSAVMKFHVQAEKDEQRRASRFAQERLNALRANDEEAYMKLIDQAKDTRITQILNQTKSYLNNLSAAVVTQQNTVSMEIPQPGDDGSSENVDYYHVAHKLKEEIHEQANIMVGGKLKEYQVKGLQWMISLYNNRLNGILADEMGLGKTIQTISLITYLIEKKGQKGPFLIIVPLGTITNWQLEFEKWAPSVHKIVFKGSPPLRKRMAQEIRHGSFNVVLTTFEYIIKEKAVLSKVKWVYLIIDEGHRMKNAQSKLSTTLMQYYQTRYRLILTGTPLQNNLPELWNLLNFILPKIFNSIKSFDDWFSSPFSSQGSSSAAVGQAALELTEEERLLMVKGLHKALRPFLLRRLKKDVESELPDKVEIIVKCAMSSLQRKITERIKVLRNIGPFDVNNANSGSRALNNLVMQFRKVCNHPFVFPEVEEMLCPGETQTTDMIFRAAGKFELLDRIIPKFLRTGHRMLMFFQMTQIMDIMGDFLTYRGWRFLRLDGHIKSEDRGGLLKEFNDPNSEYNIFILSTRAGGLGLNLQTADTVVIFDSDWNPHQDLQAQDRAHRIGQTKEVRILRLITTNSIEEHILSKAQQKLNLDEKVIQAGKFDQKTTEKEREELLKLLFEKEEGKDDSEENSEFTDEQLNEMLARSAQELEIFAEMDRERTLLEQQYYPGRPRLLAEPELPPIYQVDLESMREEEKDQLMSRGARERKNVRYNDNLTEEQFCEAVESGNLENVLEARRNAPRRIKSDSAGPIASIASDSGDDPQDGDANGGEGDDDPDDSDAIPEDEEDLIKPIK
ncbi:hypothetical protein HK101_003150, partial [Irineochytrium annulatum]